MAVNAVLFNEPNLFEVHNVDRFIGLAQGYLSRLLAQAGTPSSALVLLLGLIARDPQARLSEVQAYWRAPRPEPELLAVLNLETNPLR